MPILIVTAVLSFCCGFFAAALLTANRRQDAARASELLADAVDRFTGVCRATRDAPGDCVTVARSHVDGLRRALDAHDQMRSA
jgi:hypothetical protein